MILAVDVGNSNTTVGLFNGTGELLFRALLETSRSQDPGSVRHRAPGRLSALWGGCVHGRRGHPLQRRSAADYHLHRCHRPPDRHPPMVVGPGIRTGLNIKAEIHNQLGSDIVASSVAAIAKYPSPIVMVDMGTATSLSLIVGSVYEGCIIMPGLALALDALSERRPLFRLSPLKPPPRWASWATPQRRPCAPACSTDTPAWWTGCWSAIEESIGQSVTTVATGGNAPRILRYCKRPIQYDADLIMTGLYLLYQKNAKKYRKA